MQAVATAFLAMSLCFTAFAQVPPSPTIGLMAAPIVVITNKPVVIHFDAWPTNWFLTNSVKQTQWIGSTTANGMTTDSNYTVTVTTRMQMPSPTNYIVTATIGRNRSGLQTNFVAAIITNRGPATLWLSPTNKYTIALWAMFRDGWTNSAGFADWPAAPSNQLRFISTPLFSKNLRDWTVGTNTYTFTVTNGIDYGTNLFVRWSTVAVKDDFTQKAVVFNSNTFGMFPTNAP